MGTILKQIAKKINELQILLMTEYHLPSQVFRNIIFTDLKPSAIAFY